MHEGAAVAFRASLVISSERGPTCAHGYLLGSSAGAAGLEARRACPRDPVRPSNSGRFPGIGGK